MQSIKETAVNVAASAKSGMDKTKAVVQEKVEKIAAGNSTEKQIAAERKEEKIHNAELEKQQMKQAAHAGAYSHSTTGATGQPMGGHQMSALPGHGTGEPAGQVVEGTVKSHPIGAATGTGTGRPNTAHNTHVGGGTNTGYGTGGAWSG